MHCTCEVFSAQVDSFGCDAGTNEQQAYNAMFLDIDGEL